MSTREIKVEGGLKFTELLRGEKNGGLRVVEKIG